MADLDATYRIRLSDEFKAKRRKNARYSQNAYAKFLGLDTTYASKLLKGKIILSLDLANQIVERLNLKTEERKEFLLSVAEEQKCHALYLIDPSLTDCNSELHESNCHPKARKKIRD